MDNIVFQIETDMLGLERKRAVYISDAKIVQTVSTSFANAEETVQRKNTASVQAAKQCIDAFQAWETVAKELDLAMQTNEKATIERLTQRLSAAETEKHAARTMLSSANRELEYADEILLHERTDYKHALEALEGSERDYKYAEERLQKTIAAFLSRGS
jgi:hypothetical protein